VRGPNLGDVNLETGMRADEDAGPACMIEMDMADEEVADVGKRKATLCEAVYEGRQVRGRTTIEERRPVVGLEEIRADDAFGTEVAEIDQVGDPAMLPDRRPNGSGCSGSRSTAEQ
jgi:hypothetical protein